MGYMTPIGLYVPDWTGLTIAAFTIGLTLSLCGFLTIIEATPYSKFGNRKAVDNIPSKYGMLALYTPSVIACLALHAPMLPWRTQFGIVQSVLLIHFLKRIIEVLFVHIYRSKTNIVTILTIMSSYTITTVLDLLVMRCIPNDVFHPTLTIIGLVFFFVGESINGYHHWLLRNLRSSNVDKTKESTDYKLPKGGLFNYAVAPHYAAEQLAFIGFIMCSQNVVSLVLKLFPFIYLTIRAKKTYDWYSVNLTDKEEKTKLAQRKYLIPFVW